MARDTRQDASSCHHLDAGVDLVGHRQGELVVRGTLRVDVLAVDVVDPTDTVVAAPEDEVAVGVQDGQIRRGILLDLDAARHVVELLEEGDHADGQVLHHDRFPGRGDDEVAHAHHLFAAVRVAVGDVDDECQLAGLPCLAQRPLEGVSHRCGAEVRLEQLRRVHEVVHGQVHLRPVAVAVGDGGDGAVTIDVEREAQHPGDHGLHRTVAVVLGHRARAVDHEHHLEADAGQIDLAEGVGGRGVGLAQVDTTRLVQVDGWHLLETDGRLAGGVEGERRRTGRLGESDEATRGGELLACDGGRCTASSTEHGKAFLVAYPTLLSWYKVTNCEGAKNIGIIPYI